MSSVGVSERRIPLVPLAVSVTHMFSESLDNEIFQKIIGVLEQENGCVLYPLSYNRLSSAFFNSRNLQRSSSEGKDREYFLINATTDHEVISAVHLSGTSLLFKKNK